jgi:hypothetical protein
MSIEVMKQALEALEQIKCSMFHPAKVFTWDPSIIALRAAIEQAEQQAPYIAVANDRITIDPVTGNVSIGIPAAPRQWVELTDDEARALVNRVTFGDRTNWQALIYIVDAKLKEKNAA